jgi:drug/metabolite transporter (DMT)-like permease
MQTRDGIELVLLGALWGASFLLMRVAVPEFGPLALILVRVALAGLFLAAALAARNGLAELRKHAGPLVVLGTINSALPFSLLAYATLSITAGFASILNATVPMWGALVAYGWLGERLSTRRVVGLATGFAGVLVLVWGQVSFKPGGAGVAVVAGLAAAFSYGVAANYTKRSFADVDPMVSATGSQLGATAVLLPLAIVAWPANAISWRAWASVIVLAIACTGLAYILYFRLIARIGPTRAVVVAFLIPLFAVVWGALLLDETVTLQMLAGGAIILAGTALAIGIVRLR